MFLRIVASIPGGRYREVARRGPKTLREQREMVVGGLFAGSLAVVLWQMIDFVPNWRTGLLIGIAVSVSMAAFGLYSVAGYCRSYSTFYRNGGNEIVEDYATPTWQRFRRLRWMLAGGLKDWSEGYVILLLTSEHRTKHRSRSQLDMELQVRAECYARAQNHQPLGRSMQILHFLVRFGPQVLAIMTLVLAVSVELLRIDYMWVVTVAAATVMLIWVSAIPIMKGWIQDGLRAARV